MIYSEDGDGVTQDVFKAIFVNDFDGLQKIYAKHDLSTDILDEHGMTPLQHAAYKGNEQIVRWLLNRVSDCQIFLFFPLLIVLSMAGRWR